LVRGADSTRWLCASDISLPVICANSFGLISVRQMHIENLHMPVSKVVPELDGEFAEDMNVHTATRRVSLDEI
jgi:hypothetical protein